jgi:hypothetical protein
MRQLHELLERQDPAWPEVESWIQEATNAVELLPPSEPARGEALLASQVTTRSPMGAVIYETGGLLIDHGWLRVLGSGHPRLPRSLPGWNHGRSSRGDGGPPPFLLIADDVLGGFFALNGGRFAGKVGVVWYGAPDSLEWESLDATYTVFLQWCLSGDLAGYYASQRWPGWEEEVSRLAGDQGYTIYPPLCTQGPPIGERSRAPAPLAELYGLYLDSDA